MTPDDPDWEHDVIISEYIGAFAARADLHVVNGAALVREPLDPTAVRKAIMHHYPLSGYLSTEDNRTHVGALDFDNDEGFRQAWLVGKTLDQHNIASLITPSRRGAHLWVTCWNWSDVGTMNRALRAAVALSLGDEQVANTKIEVFPKRGDDLAGGALRLPGLVHHKTQTLYPVWLAGGENDQPTFRDILEGHVLSDADAIKRLAGTNPPSVGYPKGIGDFYGWREKRDYGPAPSASDVLTGWGVPGARPGATVRCPKHDDRHRSLTIMKDDQRVYCGAPHCILNGQGHGVGSYNLSLI